MSAIDAGIEKKIHGSATTTLIISNEEMNDIIKLAGPLMKVAVPIAKKVLVPLGLTAAMFAIGAGIQEKIDGSGTTSLTISNEEMNDIMKIVQALEDSNIFLKGVTKTIKNETKEQKGGFLSMLLGTVGASLLGNLLSGKGIVRDGYGSSI